MKEVGWGGRRKRLYGSGGWAVGGKRKTGTILVLVLAHSTSIRIPWRQDPRQQAQTESAWRQGIRILLECASTGSEQNNPVAKMSLSHKICGTATSAADRYIRHVPYLDKLQPEGSPNFSYQTHVTDISIGRACTRTS